MGFSQRHDHLTMSTDRNSFLQSLNATVLDNGHCRFDSDDNRAEAGENFIAPLSHYGLLRTAGPDSAKFLQGQTTCNLDEIDDQQARPGAYCSPKGRMVSSFLAGRRNDQDYLLRMRRDIVASTQATFGKYIVFSKAEQSDISAQTVILGLYGPQAKDNIEAAFGACPAGQHQLVHSGDQLAIQLDEAGQCFECWLTIDQAEQLWPRLSHNLDLRGSEQWQLLTIQQGIGEVGAATVGEFIPQLLNFPQIGAVSFNKGCYTGQEVVARMHYRGKPKRGMYRIQLSGAAPQEGQELYSDGDQSIGTIVNAVAVGADQYQALAVLAHDQVDKPIRRQDEDSAITLMSLPYAITEDTE